MKNKIAIILVCLSVISGSVYASGFGVSEQVNTNSNSSGGSNQLSDNAKLMQLLNQPKSGSGATNQAVQPVSSAATTAVAGTNSATAASNANANKLSESDDVGNAAFSNTVRNMMPMSPEQIKTLRYMLDQSQRAAATYPTGTSPRPTSSSVIVNLSPGATPPIIRLRSGFVTSLDFLDATGASWPIAAFDLGDPNSFNVQWNRTGNTLLIQSETTYKSGNLAVILKGMDTPVMITLMPGQSNVDYRVDLRVPGMGPNATLNMNGLPETSNPALINFLDGVAPKGAHALIVSGDGQQSQGWLYAGKLYLRTRVTVLSPGWLSTMSSPDGTHVYELPKTPVVLASQQGTMIQLMIKGL